MAIHFIIGFLLLQIAFLHFYTPTTLPQSLMTDAPVQKVGSIKKALTDLGDEPLAEPDRALLG